jgi:hypothetical protein
MLDKINFIEVYESRLVRNQSAFTSKKEAAAARSTGLRPIHFSNRGNGHGSQLPAKYYKLVISGK